MKLLSRREYLSLCAETTFHYKRLIERKIKVDLEDVGVNGISPITLAKDLTMEIIKGKKQKKDYSGVCLFISGLPLIFPFIVLNLYLTPRIAEPVAFYEKPNILFNTRKSVRTKALAYGIERVVVHELSHHLWGILGGETEMNGDNKRLMCMNEGFANYCDGILFSDLYPRGKFSRAELRKFPRYELGTEAVKTIVKKFGEKQLFQIPKNWERLLDETNDRELLIDFHLL